MRWHRTEWCKCNIGAVRGRTPPDYSTNFLVSVAYLGGRSPVADPPGTSSTVRGGVHPPADRVGRVDGVPRRPEREVPAWGVGPLPSVGHFIGPAIALP